MSAPQGQKSRAQRNLGRNHVRKGPRRIRARRGLPQCHARQGRGQSQGRARH
jgi:hypothetical protein